MNAHVFSYKKALAASERIRWRVEDIIGEDKPLDFSRPFLPESLARVQGFAFLDRDEKRKLNQIRGHNYLYLFGLVEEFILPFVIDHARPTLSGDDARTRAMLQFAAEEAKHIDLFKRFRAAFQEGFGTDCDVIGPAEAVAKAVLAHHPLAVALVILHIEWMTQRHFLDSIKVDASLDQQFKSLLRHHWMEEAQHAQLDTLMVEAIAAESGPGAIDAAIEGYLAIGGMLDQGLRQQIVFDAASFERATGRDLEDEEREELIDVQHQAMRWTFLGSGMTHPNFLGTVGGLSATARRRIEDIAPTFA
jgi:hypothetical protein